MNCGDRRDIDVSFDFTTDTPCFWDRFWERNSGLGAGGNDPDILSKTLQRYHQLLWSRELPNGQTLELSTGKGASYLTWKDFRFGSDSIVASFRYNKYRAMLSEIESSIPDYRAFVENYLRAAYTIGGAIIFPKRRCGSINQSRGCNPQIKDRWDLTLECIRKFYLGEPSPLYDTLMQEKPYFDLFVNFEGFVNFFFLQDCVSTDYQSVTFWLGDGTFTCQPLPKTIDDYFRWIDRNLEFVQKRNQRIQGFCNKF